MQFSQLASTLFFVAPIFLGVTNAAISGTCSPSTQKCTLTTGMNFICTSQGKRAKCVSGSCGINGQATGGAGMWYHFHVEMKFLQLYTYPIKSLRATLVQQTQVTDKGFPYDRRFMLLKIHEDATKFKSTNGSRYQNMFISQFHEMSLFATDVVFPDESNTTGQIIVTYLAPEKTTNSAKPDILYIPLLPDISKLSLLDAEVMMHASSTAVYVMGPEYNDWFSTRFGYEVILVYLGQNSRGVLMSRPETDTPLFSYPSWVWRLTGGAFISALGTVAGAIGIINTKKKQEEDRITFADCAAYLVVSDTSVQDVSSRLANGIQMDVYKLRPNIVVSGADEPWEEDFWAELRIGDASFELIHNCARCASLNIDYDTGKRAEGEKGMILKKLQKDRRVDEGSRYSPICGRYGFIKREDSGKVIAVGDEVFVTKRNEKRSTFDWPTLVQ